MNLKEQDIVKIGFFETNDDYLELINSSLMLTTLNMKSMV